MCRSIKTLRTLDVPADEDEVRAAALQYVRKVSGYRKPSPANEVAFNRGRGRDSARLPSPARGGDGHAPGAPRELTLSRRESPPDGRSGSC